MGGAAKCTVVRYRENVCGSTYCNMRARELTDKGGTHKNKIKLISKRAVGMKSTGN